MIKRKLRRRAFFGAAFGLLLALTGVSARSAGQDIHPEQEPITPIPAAPSADERKVALGAYLFNDPRLSRDGKFSCASCHDLQTNGTAPQSTAAAAGFNTPTIFNAALNFRLNWQGNFRALEDQARNALADRNSMATTVDAAVQVISQQNGVQQRFQEAYGHAPDSASLLDAIATFERSLLTPDSLFDRWLRGDEAALSAEQMRGYRLFKSLGCISCHQGVNVGGNLFERSGVFHNLTSGEAPILRVPSLRNVAVTAPYFHNGSTATLPEAVRKMAYAQLDRALSDDEINAVVEFLRTLTGSYQGRTLTAPP